MAEEEQDSEGDKKVALVIDSRFIDLIREIQQYEFPGGKKQYTMIKRADGFMQIVVPADAPQRLKDMAWVLWDDVMEWMSTQ